MPNTPRNAKDKPQEDKPQEDKPQEDKPQEAIQEREEAIQEILRRVEEKLRRRLTLGEQTLDQIEEQSQEIGEEVKRIIEEESLQAIGPGYRGRHLLCPQGHQARYAGLRSRLLITQSGSRTLQRAYYACSACGQGWCPSDRTLGLGKGQCSRRVQTLIARFSSYLPDRTAAQELEAVCGVRLSTRTVQTYSRRVGGRIAKEWEQWQSVRETDQLPSSSLPSSSLPAVPSHLHVTMDGVMIHVAGAWHEAKLGCVYQTNAKGVAVQTRYSATLANSAAFGKRVRVLAHRSGADRCRDVAVVADGAAWIWQEVGKYFPRSVQVLDFYHVLAHLWAYAQARFGEGCPGTVSQAECDWMVVQKRRLLSDEAAAVLADIASWHPRQEGKRKVREQLLGYLTEHAHRLRYKTFLAAGYHIGSGVAESGCKTVVQHRMKGAGMRWGRAGAEAMLHLCSAWKSAGATDFHRYTAN
jgi:hypothetical protein